MKKIILIDIGLEWLQLYNNIEDINISALFIPKWYGSFDELKKKFKCLQKTKLFFIEDLVDVDISKSFDMDIVESFRETQLRAKFLYDRLDLDEVAFEEKYYSALFFWYDLLTNIKPDMVYIGFTEHGSIFDSIPIDMAKYMNIQCYNQIDVKGGEWFKIYNNNNKELVPIPDASISMETLRNGLSSVTFFEKDFYTEKLIPFIKELAKFFENILHGKISKYKLWGISYSFFSCAKNFIYSFYMIYKYKKYVKKIHINDTFVYYPLHFDPESVTGVQSKFRSQLLIVEMISKALPNGWFLYVKEHPDQFRINFKNCIYFYATLSKYRNIYFYDKISKLNNVKLIDEAIKTSDLLKKTRAVISITGTICLESLNQGIPVIQFEKSTSLFKNVNKVYICESFTDIEKAFWSIANEKYGKKDDIEKIVRYIFEKNECTYNKIMRNLLC